ncbi:MAG: DUF6298 domain-containing protein [Firmicutes bacterium]|nr:DUF6298 domain-containing protein [Bacillota bacterium]
MPADHSTPMGPLRPHPRNPRYFANARGRAIYLTGSHTWMNLQDMGTADPPKPFDFSAYLDFLVQHHHNFIRLWSWQSTGAWIFPRITPHPWRRTGPGNASDGKPRFDLTQRDAAYFRRLRERVQLARQRGIYVSVMLFVGGNVSVPDEWKRHPFRRGNNVNGVDGDIDGDGTGKETVTLQQHRQLRTVREIQLEYVRHVIDTVNEFDNVLYEIINEGGTREWDWFMVNFIHEYEQTKPLQHPVGLTGHGGESNDSMLSSPAEWFSPGASEWRDLLSNPRVADGRKVSILDTDHLWGEGGDYLWVWKSFLRGHNPIYMDRIAALTGDTRGDIPGAESARKAMGLTRQIAEQTDMAAMVPRPELASTGYCLAHEGREYVVFLPETRKVQVNLSASRKPLTIRWIHPVEGTVKQGKTVQGGARRELESPFEGDAVLWMRTI